MSTSSASPGRSAERSRRLALLRSGDVEPSPGPPRARSRGGKLLTADITAGTATKYRRALDNFDIFLVVTRAVCFLHMDSSSLSMLPRDTWSELVGLMNLFLVLQEPWSLLCVDLFFLARGSRPNVLESVRVESPPSFDFDPDMPSQETVGLRIKIGSVTLEEASFLLSTGANEDPSTGGERENARTKQWLSWEP